MIKQIKNNQIKNSKNKGFSLTELLIVLALGGTCVAVASHYYFKYQKQTLRKTEISATTDYAKAVSAFANAYQVELYKNTYSGNVVTISPQKLVQYGFLRNVKKIKDPVSGEQIYPCASIYFAKEKLQGMVYYRTDSNKLNGQDTQRLFMSEGLKSAGNDGGFLSIDKDNNTFIQNNFTKFVVDAAQINKYFPKAGSATLLDDGQDSCQGANLAIPSYTSYMANVLGGINSELNPDNTVKQNTNEIVTDNPNNNITQLNMDGTDVANASLKTYAGKNKIVFQNNEDCQMNPEVLSTMQDYNPDCPGPANVCKLDNVPSGVDTTQNCNSITDDYSNNGRNVINGCGKLPFPNKFGCRNKQLSLGYTQMQVSNGIAAGNSVKSDTKDVTVINGFDEVDNTYSKSENAAKVTNLGKLRAQTAQATALVDYAQVCSQSEVGGIAKQMDYKSRTDNLGKLYSINQSVMICQKNALCNDETSVNTVGYCWLPLMPITVKVNFTQGEHILSYKAPKGFFILNSENYADNNGKHISAWADNQVASMGGFGNGGEGGGSDGGSTCKKEWHSGFPKYCNTHTDGSLIAFSNMGSVSAYNTVYHPASQLVDTNRVPAYNGWEVWKIDNPGSRMVDPIAKDFYFSNCGGDTRGGSCAYSTPNQKINVANNALKQYTQIGGLPKIANPKFNMYYSRWGVSGTSNFCGYRAECDQWKGRIFTNPNFLKSVTITNDTSSIEVNQPYIPTVVPDDPSGNCNTIPQMIQDAASQEASTTIHSINNESAVVVPGSYSITANPNGAYCTAKATAKYCPNVATQCSYTLTYQIGSNCYSKWGNDLVRGNRVKGTGFNNGARIEDESCCGHSTAVVDNTKLGQWVQICGNYGGISTMTTITPGSCVAPENCANPTTLEVYSGDYPLQ